MRAAWARTEVEVEGALWVSCSQPFSEDLLLVEELKEQKEPKEQEELVVWRQAASVPQRLRAWPVENFLAKLRPRSWELLGFWVCHNLQQSLYLMICAEQTTFLL